MRRLWIAFRLAGRDTLYCFGNFPPLHLLVWFTAGLFLGWNGLQLLISDRYLFLFADRFSFTIFAYSAIKGKLAWEFYVLLFGGGIAAWLLKSVFETLFLDWHKERPSVQAIRRGLYFGVSTLTFMVIFAIILSGVFFIPYLVHLIWNAYPLRYALSLQQSIAFAVIEGVVFGGIFATWFVDFVLPLQHLGFRQACAESWHRLHLHPAEHIFVYAVRAVSVAFSLFAWVYVVRFLLFPAVLWVSQWLHTTPFKGFNAGLSLVPDHPLYWLTNLGQLGITILFFLMCASPLMLPLWTLQRYLMRRVFHGIYTEY